MCIIYKTFVVANVCCCKRLAISYGNCGLMIGTHVLTSNLEHV